MITSIDQAYKVCPVFNLRKDFKKGGNYDLSADEITDIKLEVYDLHNKLKKESVISELREDNLGIGVCVELSPIDGTFEEYEIPQILFDFEQNPEMIFKVETLADKKFYVGVCNALNVLLFPHAENLEENKAIYFTKEPECWILGKERDVVSINRYYLHKKESKYFFEVRSKHIGRHFLRDKKYHFKKYRFAIEKIVQKHQEMLAGKTAVKAPLTI